MVQIQSSCAPSHPPAATEEPLTGSPPVFSPNLFKIKIFQKTQYGSWGGRDDQDRP